MTLQDILDPTLDPSYKGFPHHAPPMRRSAIGSQGWNVLRGDLPLPLAVIRGDALAGNLRWMQEFAAGHGVGLAPHGKTTMSPQLFRRQLEGGAWGLTFASVVQLRAGVAAGAQRCIVANQVFRAIPTRARCSPPRPVGPAARAARASCSLARSLAPRRRPRAASSARAARTPCQPAPRCGPSRATWAMGA